MTTAPHKENSFVSDPKLDLVGHCESAVQFYEQRPGLHGPGTAIDLYTVCAELASRVAELEKRVQQLLEPVR